MSQATGFQAWYTDSNSAATNLTQSPVPHDLDFSYCSTAWAVSSTSSGGSSNALPEGAVAGIAVSIVVLIVICMLIFRVSVLGFDGFYGGKSTLSLARQDAALEMK